MGLFGEMPHGQVQLLTVRDPVSDFPPTLLRALHQPITVRAAQSTVAFLRSQVTFPRGEAGMVHRSPLATFL